MARLKQILAAILLCVLSVLSHTPTVYANEASSANYGVREVNFGSGGELYGCSASYCSKQSAGETAVGNTSSANYQAQGGQNTNREEYLNVSVPGGIIDLGVLSTAAPKFGSTTFSVSAYLASGYTVIVSGAAPRNMSSGRSLATMSTPDVSKPGTAEQFGINLKQNTVPAVGSNEQQQPDSSFGFGVASPGYSTPNYFKFVSGDTIAQSSKSSSTTTYTMSVIENITTATAAGAYRTNLTIMAVPSF